MGSTLVVGLQWGDEAKGKVVDLLTDRHDVVVRFNGGANAGHTIVVEDQVYKFSLIPSGITRPEMQCVIGNGTAVDPERLLEEVDGLLERGLSVEGRLWLSEKAHVILPYHREEDRVREEAAGLRAIGTTRRGIGPCYADKAVRLHALRVRDLLDGTRLQERLEDIVPYKNRVLRAIHPDAESFETDALLEQYHHFADRLRPFVCDTFWLLQRSLREGQNVLFEAAQGSLLDLDHGTFPYVTSSNSSACGLAAGCGVSPRRIDTVIGIVKAYTTRVGGGPFPTELHDATGDHIREEGNEFGTVTGRPRRCGWFDAVAGRYTALLNDVDRLGVMLLDVLGKLDEVKICEAYEIDGERTTEFPATADDLAKAQPVYRSLPGWKRDLRACRKAADLPKEARSYVDTISEYLGVPALLCSVGPARDATVFLDDLPV